MKFKKYIILSIFLLAILALGTVSAVNDENIDNVTDIVSFDDSHIDLQNDEIDNLDADALSGEDKSSSDNSDNQLGEVEIINPGNIDRFDDGIVPSGNYKFEGTFENKSDVLFENGCTVDASEAEFVNMGVNLHGNVTLKGLTLTSTSSVNDDISPGTLVYVTGDNNCLESLTINYSPESGSDAYAVYINAANNFTLINSEITFTGVSLSSYYEYAIKIINSQQGLIKSNVIRANLPILDVDYNNGDPGLDTDFVLNTGIKESYDLDIIGNTFIADVISRNGDYPTLDCLMMESCNRINIINNTFNETDFITSQGDTNYLNVLDMYYSSNVLVQNNTISVETSGGSQDAGTSYPIQITGPYEDVVVDGNVIYAYCHGPALGIYSQNYYGDTEILVANNRINVTGLPTFNSWGLVSGIELQDSVARVYGNVINTQSVTGNYQNGSNLYGISYAQALRDDHNYDIRENIVETQGQYAVYILKAQNLIISNNSLISSAGEGDDAIYVKALEGTSDISGNYGHRYDNDTPENVVTQDNFFEFFNDGGELNDDVQFDELIFKGEFDNIDFPLLIVNPLTITGEDAVLKNVRILIYASNVKLDNLTFMADSPLESLIYIEGSDVYLTNLNITYLAGDEGAVAIDIKGTNDVYLLNNTIFFESHVASDENVAAAIQAIYCRDIVIDNNEITTKLPCISVNNYDEDYYVMGSNNVNPMRFKACNNLRFTGNSVNSTTNNCSAEFPTIQSIYIIGCSDSLIDNNIISMIDEFTPQGMDNYMYGICFGYDTNVTFSNNNFNMSTKGGKDAAGTAYAFQGVCSEVIIRGNNIFSKSYGPNLGVYITSLGGESSEVLIEDNFINVTGRASHSGSWALVSGIEIQNGNARIYNNTIYAYNVNEYDEAAYFYGISYAQFMHGSRSLDIQRNTVHTGGKYAVSVIDADYLYVIDNTLYSYDLTGDDSIDAGKCSNVEIDANMPGSTKLDAGIAIEIPSDIKVGQTIVINVTANTTSELNVSIDGEHVDLVDGKVVYEVGKGGLHTVNVFAKSNTEFKRGNVTEIFSASKLDAVISLNQFVDVKIGDVVVISPQTDSDGELTVKVNDVVVDGSYTVRSAGLYVVSVVSAETDMYNAGFANATFDVAKFVSSVNITLVPARAGEKSSVLVSVSEGAGGTVIVNVNGTEYPINVSDGKLELALGVGEYSVFANYTGDDCYEGSVSEVKTLAVLDKSDANIVIEIPSDVKAGQTIVINVTADTTADLVVSIDGELVNLVGGKITYEVGKGGLHTVNVFASANGDFKAGNVSETFNASKLDAVISLNQFVDVKIGDVVVISPQTDSNGELTVKVNGVVVDGSYTVRSAGLYVVSVVSAETDMYNAGFANATFDVAKFVSSVNITLVPARAGEKSSIFVSVTDGAGGTVIVNVNGTEYPINVSDGKLELALGVGEYSVFANYTGDDCFESSVSEVTTLTVLDKLDAGIVIEIPDDVKVGQTLTINVTADTTSDLVVSIDGEHVDLIDGKITYLVTKSGLHEINVYSDKNSQYEQGNLTESFNASKNDAIITLNHFDNVKVGDVIVITPQSNSDGELTIRVNGEVVDGNYIILSNGTYQITVVSAETEAYKEGFANTTFDAFKSQSSVYADSIEIVEGEIAKLTIVLNDGAIGKVAVVVNETTYYGNISDGNASVNITGLTFGHYEAYITYLGDEKYNASSNISSIDVKKSISDDDLEIVDASSASNEFTVSLPSDATGNVSFELNGVSYTQKLVNGKATFKLPEGKYSLNIIYSGDENYGGFNKTTQVSVKNETSDVSNDTQPVRNGSSSGAGDVKSDASAANAQPAQNQKTASKIIAKKKTFKSKTKIKKYTVTLKAGKKPIKKVWITLKIKGKIYRAKTNNKGKATFKIKKLTKKGSYMAVIKFNGNSDYKGATAKVKIIIKK